jgi:hypothetical protein
MYEYWMREAGYWLPRVEETFDKGFLHRQMNVFLKRALACFMVEECV